MTEQVPEDIEESLVEDLMAIESAVRDKQLQARNLEVMNQLTRRHR